MKEEKRPYSMAVRVAKAEETRERILKAASDLYLRAGADGFTLDEVAAAAGVAVRTVLRIHGSRDRLLYAALDVLARGGVPLQPTPPGDIAAAVQAIFGFYEAAGDMVLQQLADERGRPELRAINEVGRADHRDWVNIAFAPLLDACGEAGRARLFNAVVVATDVYTWAKLRRDNGLSRGEAEAIAGLMIEAIADKEANHGEVSLAQLVGRREPAA